MEITKEMIPLILEIEETIGGYCYNPHSYDGWREIQGKEYRYLPTYLVGDGPDAELKKSAYWLNKDITTENVRSMHYRFGANHLYIAKGIIEAMGILEQRYGIDFNALEKQYRESET